MPVPLFVGAHARRVGRIAPAPDRCEPSTSLLVTGVTPVVPPCRDDRGRQTGGMAPQSTVLVTGASGFIGSRLAPALVEAGHEVRAMTRHPDRYDGAGEAGVRRRRPTSRACARRWRAWMPRTTSCTPWIRTTSSSSTPRRRRPSGTRPPTPGVRQIVYLGGLGDLDDKLSAHLRSRRDVEQLWASAACR